MVLLAGLHGLTESDSSAPWQVSPAAWRHPARSLVGPFDPDRVGARGLVFLAIADAGLPLPGNHSVDRDRFGAADAVLDFAYRRARVVVEYDGEEAHEAGEAEDEERPVSAGNG